MTAIPFHRYAEIFPLLGADELRDLAEDIRLNGLRRPIEILDRAVLDGRNRHDALVLLIESGAPRGPGWGAYEGQPLTGEDLDLDAGLPWFEKYNGALNGDPLDYVWSLNYARRHLTASQRAACAAEYEGYRQGRPRSTTGDPDNPANLQVFNEAESPAPAPQTRTERAEKLGVSERTLADADKVHERSPELHQAVKAGEVTADVAAALSEKPAEQVKALLDALPRDQAGKLLPEATRELRGVVTELRQQKNEEKKQRREAREREQGAMQLALPDKKYGVIIEDPEWDFEVYSRDTGMDRHAANHYATSPDDAIAARPVIEIAADDCVYGLWCTDLARGLDLLRKRGFTFKSYFVWVKDIVDYEIDPATRKALGIGAERFLHVVGAPGTGFWNRDRDELLLIGVNGNPPCPAMGTQGESVWFAPRPHVEGSEKDQHSAKPDICFDWFDTHFPSFRKIELNARKAREGWDTWGLEAPKPKFAPADEDPETPADDADDEVLDLPPMPWAAGDAAAEQVAESSPERPDELGIPAFLRRTPEPSDAEHAADAAAESDNEAAEAAGHSA